MPKGWCRGCGELVEIRPGPRHDPTGQRSSCAWYPVPHPRIGGPSGEVVYDATNGAQCPGVEKEL
jgi:hypothetical protein